MHEIRSSTQMQKISQILKKSTATHQFPCTFYMVIDRLQPGVSIALLHSNCGYSNSIALFHGAFRLFLHMQMLAEQSTLSYKV
jgi:hypothetical protein